MAPAPTVPPIAAPAAIDAIFDSLCQLIVAELEAAPQKTQSLNPSRRRAIFEYLGTLAGRELDPPQPDPGAARGAGSASLPTWDPSCERSSQAAREYYQRLARIWVGQCLILKAWSDRGIRRWSRGDLAQLNWTLASALRPHVPLDRSGWQLTMPNLFSWFSPSSAAQGRIFEQLELLRTSELGPHLLASLLRPAADQTFASAISHALYGELWNMLLTQGFAPTPASLSIKRLPLAFSPSLRDGAIVRSGPTEYLWHGLESDPYLLCSAELSLLWWGPSAPPLWSQGYGPEVFPRAQLAMTWSSPKPGPLNRLAELEAFDVAWVLEEGLIRLNAREPRAKALRALLEELPAVKRLKGATTTLGTLQACTALAKLRPGGVLVWARSERVSTAEGNDALKHLLEHARFARLYDLSGVDLSALPAQARGRIPQVIYLLVRDTDLPRRHENRMQVISVQGALRSQIEVESFFAAVFGPLREAGSDTPPAVSSVASPELSVWLQPHAQGEWLERWPESAESEVLTRLERVRKDSVPLASLASVVLAPSLGTDDAGQRLHGFSVHAELRDQRRQLRCRDLEPSAAHASERRLFVLVRHEGWVTPLREYLESMPIQLWLEHHAERRAERWALSEQVLRFVPVPQWLTHALSGNETFARPLPGGWERQTAEWMARPPTEAEAEARVRQLAVEPEGARVRAHLFVRAARARQEIAQTLRARQAFVRPDGTVRWAPLLASLDRSWVTTLGLQSDLRLVGQLPPDVPISQIQRLTRRTQPTFLLASESGYHLEITTPSTLLGQILAEVLEGVGSITWRELNDAIQLPRRLEPVAERAQTLVRESRELQARDQSLAILLGACLAL